MRESNARITSTMLGYEDHGILTFFLQLDYGHSAQGAGGWALDTWDANTKKRVATKWAGEMLAAVLKTFGKEKWEDLPGTPIRVKYDHDRVHAIGHLLEDKWIEFDSLFGGQE